MWLTKVLTLSAGLVAQEPHQDILLQSTHAPVDIRTPSTARLRGRGDCPPYFIYLFIPPRLPSHANQLVTLVTLPGFYCSLLHLLNV